MSGALCLKVNVDCLGGVARLEIRKHSMLPQKAAVAKQHFLEKPDSLNSARSDKAELLCLAWKPLDDSFTHISTNLASSFHSPSYKG